MVKSSSPQKLLKFKDILDSEEIVFNMYEDLRFIEDLESMIEPTLMGYMLSGKFAAYAEERYENKKIELTEFHGQLDEHYRDLSSADSGRVTESALRSKIESNPEYITRAKRLTKFKRQCDVLKYFNKAFQMKAELLRTKAADRRRELDDLGMSPPTVSKKRKEK